MRRYSEPYDLSTAMPHDQQAIEQAERDCRHDEQIDRGDTVGMIAEELFHPWDGGPLRLAIYLATLGQPPVNRFATGTRVAEQIELTCIAVRMAVSGRRARHGHLPDSRRESPMLRLNPAIAMVCPKRTSHPAAALPRRSARQCQHRVRRQHARPRRPPDRTSRPESPAIARMPDQRGCNGKPLCPPSQPPHEYRPGIRPKDATDKEARTPRSRGRSVVVLYNSVRTHRSLNKDAPVTRQIQRIGSIKSHAILGGLHHHYARA